MYSSRSASGVQVRKEAFATDAARRSFCQPSGWNFMARPHAKLVEYKPANHGRADLLLIDDSITQQRESPLDTGKLNAAWQKHFGSDKPIRIGGGIIGDKSQNVFR